MGGIGSKSPLERRNTVLRRSQRKSIHGVKSKVEKLHKQISKFKETEESSAYVDLKAKLEAAERELQHSSKSLQPQLRNTHDETLKKLQECYQLLEDKLQENREKANDQITKKEESEEDDEVFVEEVQEEAKKKVELTVVQVEPILGSPQMNKRYSAIRVGVPVLPGSIAESLNRKSEEVHLQHEERILTIRKEIEKLEVEISQFVGQKNGNYYNKLKALLAEFTKELKVISTNDTEILEQIKQCKQYIDSCASFLDERAVNDQTNNNDDDDYDYPVSNRPVTQDLGAADGNLSPRSIRTTYI